MNSRDKTNNSILFPSCQLFFRKSTVRIKLMQADEIIERIIALPLFLQLKNVEENIEGWHNHETVYNHSVKTATIAKEQITAPFITNEEAKEKFLHFFSQDVSGVKLSEIAILGALLHDCGKVVYFKENGKEYSLNTHIPTTKD